MIAGATHSQNRPAAACHGNKRRTNKSADKERKESTHRSSANIKQGIAVLLQTNLTYVPKQLVNLRLLCPKRLSVGVRLIRIRKVSFSFDTSFWYSALPECGFILGGIEAVDSWESVPDATRIPPD